MTTAYRYLREGLDVLAALAPTREQAIAVAAQKAYVILDGTLVRIDRVAMASGRDSPTASSQDRVGDGEAAPLADREHHGAKEASDDDREAS